MNGPEDPVPLEAVPCALAEREARLDEAIAEYLRLADIGLVPPREQFLRRHPDLLPELESFFADRDSVEEWVRRLRIIESESAPAQSSRVVDSTAQGKLRQPKVPARLGRYELGEVLGRGAFGTVYRAWDPQLARPVAVKVAHVLTAGNEEDRIRFHREARSIAQLRHPSIVGVHEVGESDGVIYLVRAYVSGRTLANVLQESRPSFHDSAALIASIADALHYAHTHGVVHRDVKPSNIVIDESGRPHLIDFGLARLAELEATLTMEGQVLGTPAYMSPEQARGQTHQADARSDIYSLGVVFYQMLSGELPFSGPARMLLYQLLHEDVKSPRILEPGLPRDLETICLRALAKDPAERYATAAALADDLRRWTDGRPVLARPIGRLGRLQRWCRRNPHLAVASGIALGAMITCIGLGVGMIVDQAHRLYAGRIQSTLAMVDRGLDECAKGEVGTGLLWLARSLQEAPDDAVDLQRLIRLNLGGWSQQLCRLEACFVHDSMITAGGFSLDGRNLLTASADATARLWRTTTGEPLGPVLKHRSPIRAARFSADSQFVLTGCEDSAGHLWRAVSGEQVVPPLSHDGHVIAVAFSPDGKIMATGGHDMVVKLWSTATGKQVGPTLHHDGIVVKVFFSPDGRTIATASLDQTARLWDVHTGSLIGQPMRHGGSVLSLAFNPVKNLLATGSSDGTARIWDSITAMPIGTALPHDGSVNQVVYSADGNMLVTASADKTARLWKTTTGQPIGLPLLHPSEVTPLALSPNADMLLTGTRHGAACLWDTRSGKLLFAFPHRDAVSVTAFGPDGKRVLTCSVDHVARLWGIATPPRGPRLQHQNMIAATAFSPDGQIVATASHDKTAQVWDSKKGDRIGPPLHHEDRVTMAVFNADGSLLMTAGLDKTARLWDAKTGRAIGPPLRHEGSVAAGAFSPDGRMAVTACRDSRARLWDVATGALLDSLVLPEQAIQTVAFSPDGTMIGTGSVDGTAQLWDVSARSPHGPPLLHGKMIRMVTFSPDGRTLLTAGDDATARLWNVATGLQRGTALQHLAVVQTAIFSPDGSLVCTGSQDRTARLWNTNTGEPIGMPLTHQGRVTAVAFSPDGRMIMTADYDKAIRLWDVALTRPIGPALGTQEAITAASLSPDGHYVIAGGNHGAAEIFVTPSPSEGTPDRITAWIQVMTGMALEANDAVRLLPFAEWRDNMRNMTDQGGTLLP